MASDLVTFFYCEIEFTKGDSNSLPDFFYHVSFYKENELSKARIQFKNHKSLLCNAYSQTRKAQYSNPK